MTHPEAKVERIDWHPSDRGGPLGRHVHHDPRSRGFAVQAAPAQQLRTTRHTRLVPVYDQGNTGSCTGNALAGALSTRPFTHRYKSERTAVQFYSAATMIDPFDGSFPPDDTGSDGLSVCKVAKARGLISSYQHAFGLMPALTALVNGPILIGVNWYDSFDQPDADGLVRFTPGAQIRGGHEMEVAGLLLETDGDVKGTDRITIPQSWGPGFGVNGWIQMEIATLERLLSEQGDVAVPVR